MPGKRAAAKKGGAQDICPGGERPVVLIKIPETLRVLQPGHQDNRPIIPIIPQPWDEQAEAQGTQQQQRQRDGANSKL